MQFLSGVSEILDLYDLYLFDQFGVLHDGIKPCPGAVAVLKGIRQQGKSAVIVSNSGRSGQLNRDWLVRLGFPPDWLPEVVTSGDCLKPWLERMAAGRRLRIYSTDALDSPPPSFDPTANPAEADLLVFNGFSDRDAGAAGIHRLLDQALERRIPMVCTEPEEMRLRGSQQHPGPGHFARLYRSKGGPVTFIGKPYPSIFEMSLARFPEIERERAVYLGDSLEHDLRGAAVIGLANVWVLSGCDGPQFVGLPVGQRLIKARAAVTAARVSPTFIMDELAW